LCAKIDNAGHGILVMRHFSIARTLLIAAGIRAGARLSSNPSLAMTMVSRKSDSAASGLPGEIHSRLQT
jgi:hypothetical protein